MRSINLIPKFYNLRKNEIIPKQLQHFYATLSFKNNHPQSQMLGFIDNLKDENTLMALHGRVIKDGSICDLGVGNYIMSLYVKFKDLSNAHKVFDELLEKDVRSWTVLISGFARFGLFRRGFGLFARMFGEGVCPNGFTLSSVFKCCSSGGLVNEGKAVHGWMITSGIVVDDVLRNSLIDFYLKCDEIDYAKMLFEFREDDIVSCNIMIGALMRVGDVESSLDLFRRLPVRDCATWNTVISGMMRNGSEGTALELLYEMAKGKTQFNELTFSIGLALVSSLSILELGAQLHGRLIICGLDTDEHIRPSLIDMYSKCGVIDKATVVFNLSFTGFSRNLNFKKMSGDKSQPDIVLWSSMISGYAQNGKWNEAVEMFCYMVHEGINVNKFTLTTVVSVCADYGMLSFGQQIHGLVQKCGCKLDLVLSSSLVDMYSKCGSLCDAWNMFNQTNTRNNVIWTAIISGYALHGHGREAVRLFYLMMEDAIQPNEVTFVAVLTACSHAGLVNEGRKIFKSMKPVYDITPEIEHFTCMVDLFGRAGQLDEIKNFIYENNLSHISSVWRAFLSSCRVHKNYDLGKWASEKLLELEPLDAEPYVLMANMCGNSNRWEESAMVRRLMQKKGVRKHPGQSWIQLNNNVHTFVFGDRTHPRQAEIYSYLDTLIGRLKQIGYCTELGQVTQDVEEEQEEMFLRQHSEKLAVVYGIISSNSGAPIRVMKNLRVCTDCHNFLKYTSQLLGREIIVRDIRRFHHFKDGICSCGDFW